jgi:hypothetical protein
MLQRSQSLFLLGVFILSVLLFTGAFTKFIVEGGELVLKHSGLYDVEGLKMELATWPVTLFISLVTGLAFLNIFFYRNRIRQMRVCVFLILLFLGMIGMMFYYNWLVKNTIDTDGWLLQWRFLIPPVCIIMLFMAFRMIRRDELLVKAYDRIR